MVDKYVRPQTEWQMNLARAIPRRETQLGWPKGEIGKTILAEYGSSLRISEGQWSGVHSGNRISAINSKEGGEIYAILFLRFEILEADPRTIPPKHQANHITKKTQLIQRAWSEKRFADFKKSFDTKQLGAKPKTDSKDTTLDDRIRRVAREEIDAVLGTKAHSGTVAIGQQLKNLIKGFRQIKSSTDRNRIQNEYESDLLRLLEIISAYTQSPTPERRDEILAMKETLDDHTK